MAAKNKTQATSANVDAFIADIDDEKKRADAQAIKAMMEELSGYPAEMWGASIVGFGRYHYRYESGREGDFMRVGFSPRKTALTLYIMPGFGEYDGLLKRLGKHKTGKSCLYVKKLADVDEGVLRELIGASLAAMEEKYPESG